MSGWKWGWVVVVRRSLNRRAGWGWKIIFGAEGSYNGGPKKEKVVEKRKKREVGILFKRDEMNDKGVLTSLRCLILPFSSMKVASMFKFLEEVRRREIRLLRPG